MLKEYCLAQLRKLNIMPKFYISDGVEQTVLEADNALQACFRCIQYRFQSIPVNGFYKVSEQGFGNHDDDIVFSSDQVIMGFLDIMEKSNTKKKRKKDKDGD